MANEFDAGAYAVSIRRTVEDGETQYEARVNELPDLLVYGEGTAAEAHTQMLDVIEVAHQAALEEAKPFPEPTQTHQFGFSGHTTVRFSRTEHARIALCAQEEGVSLNTLITLAVARMLGERDGRRQAQSAVPAHTMSQGFEAVQMEDTAPALTLGVGSASYELSIDISGQANGNQDPLSARARR